MRLVDADKDRRDAAYWDEVEEATELLQEAHFAEALVVLRDRIKANPKNPYAYHFTGVALQELGQLGPARDAYEAALRVSPGYLGARVGLSHVRRLLGDAKGALAAANEALRRSPKDPDALYAAGLAHAASGNRAEARSKLDGFLETHPEVEVSQEVRGILEMLGIGDEDEPLDLA